jgi:hypothetical protein
MGIGASIRRFAERVLTKQEDRVRKLADAVVSTWSMPDAEPAVRILARAADHDASAGREVDLILDCLRQHGSAQEAATVKEAYLLGLGLTLHAIIRRRRSSLRRDTIQSAEYALFQAREVRRAWRRRGQPCVDILRVRDGDLGQRSWAGP